MEELQKYLNTIFSAESFSLNQQEAESLQT